MSGTRGALTLIAVACAHAFMCQPWWLAPTMVAGASCCPVWHLGNWVVYVDECSTVSVRLLWNPYGLLPLCIPFTTAFAMLKLV